MSRFAPKSDVLRALFARSGNRCAFPGCTASLINDRNKFIAQVCHIEAAEPGGERNNPIQTDEERRDYANLVLFCYPHHVETDDVDQYSVQRLREMKASHEQQFEKDPFKVDESLLRKIADEMNQYWCLVEVLHENHVIPEMAIEIDARARFVDLCSKARDATEDVSRFQRSLVSSDDELWSDVEALLLDFGVAIGQLDVHPKHLRRFQLRNWDVLNIGFTNTVTKLHVLLCQLELKYLELFLQLNPHDKVARLRLDSLKAEFEWLASYAGYVD